MKLGIKPIGDHGAFPRALRAFAAYGGGPSSPISRDMYLSKVLGNEIVVEAVRVLRSRFRTSKKRGDGVLRGGESQKLERSLGYLARGAKHVLIFYDLTKAKYARILERGGVIRPFRAKALFIPLRKDVRPKQEDLVFGVDFVLAKKVTIPAHRHLSQIIEEFLSGKHYAKLDAAIGRDFKKLWDLSKGRS